MIIDQGVLDDSLRFFHEADPFTKENLFYIERAGIYHCDSTYQFAREASEIRTCQMILVEEGCLQMQKKCFRALSLLQKNQKQKLPQIPIIQLCCNAGFSVKNGTKFQAYIQS